MIDGDALVECEELPLLGQRLSQYQILEELGRGAMCHVYRARHLNSERQYAIKVLSGEFGANETVIERFKREAQLMRHIRHANVVSVIDFGRTDKGLSFLVMELVEGRSLRKVIEDEAPLKPDRARIIAQQIASGLWEAHRLGYVHRDVKPGNIMVSLEMGFEFVKLLDFGLVGLTRNAQEK